jgi:transcriptional/translational regulatory protein YebC/TACO1
MNYSNPTDFMNDFQNMMKNRRQISHDNIQHNFKKFQEQLSLFNSISITFEGSGDSGCKEGIEWETSDPDMTAEQVKVLLEKPVIGAKVLTAWSFTESGMVPVYDENILTLEEVIDSMCFDYLEMHLSGWENNDGAYGSITIDIEEKRIYMDANVRETKNYEEEMSLVE